MMKDNTRFETSLPLFVAAKGKVRREDMHV